MTSLTGRWRIVEMEAWDRDAIDLVEPGFIEFSDEGTGQFGFIAVDPLGQRARRPGRADTGNGFYGGLQFTASTWRPSAGGRRRHAHDGAPSRS